MYLLYNPNSWFEKARFYEVDPEETYELLANRALGVIRILEAITVVTLTSCNWELWKESVAQLENNPQGVVFASD